ncbi:MAG TPA: TetR/AcrR family transcriptional regulator [Xanthobacteraceae bacterium]|nr:TetR/AcrR family transcriptional regulator [Xanthobacteraceae bacterium]
MVQKEPKRRGRPRAYDPDVALARVIESFWKAGYSGTSLDDLSEATGMNRPSLYGAFGDKRDLYLKALAQYWELSLVAMKEMLAYDLPLREALRRVYAMALASYLSGKSGPRGCFAIGTATTEALQDAKIRALLAQGFGEIDDAFEARIRFARDHGELPRDADPVALAMLASATLHTLAIRSRAGASRDALEAIVETGLNVICGPSPAR